MRTRKIYAVMELVGNFSHTVKEFEYRYDAEAYLLERVLLDVAATSDLTPLDDEHSEALENALSYYSIEVWEVEQ